VIRGCSVQAGVVQGNSVKQECGLGKKGDPVSGSRLFEDSAVWLRSTDSGWRLSHMSIPRD
jgi:hypothetical protein